MSKLNEQEMSKFNEQEMNRVFKEVTLPQLKTMCEWYKEDTGKEGDWMHMLVACIAAVFSDMYEARGGLFNEKESEDDQG